jgi:hypothetical protein
VSGLRAAARNPDINHVLNKRIKITTAGVRSVRSVEGRRAFKIKHLTTYDLKISITKQITSFPAYMLSSNSAKTDRVCHATPGKGKSHYLR